MSSLAARIFQDRATPGANPHHPSMPGVFGSLFSELSAGGQGAIRDPQMPAEFRHTEVPLHCSHWLVPTEISPRSPPGHLICRRTAPQPNSLNQQVATSADIPPKSSLPFFVFFGPCPPPAADSSDLRTLSSPASKGCACRACKGRSWPSIASACGRAARSQE